MQFIEYRNETWDKVTGLTDIKDILEVKPHPKYP